MKKTYISPELVVVRLSMSKVIAASPDNFNFNGTTGSTNFIEDGTPDEVLTKGISDVNVWDNEW